MISSSAIENKQRTLAFSIFSMEHQAKLLISSMEHQAKILTASMVHRTKIFASSMEHQAKILTFSMEHQTKLFASTMGHEAQTLISRMEHQAKILTFSNYGASNQVCSPVSLPQAMPTSSHEPLKKNSNCSLCLEHKIWDWQKQSLGTVQHF